MANEPENSNDGPLDRAVSILTFVAEQKKALSAAEIAAALIRASGRSAKLCRGSGLVATMNARKTGRFLR
jgi:hypothetical protein